MPEPTTGTTTVIDMGSLLNRLLSNDYIPDDIKANWMILMSDDLVMTFFNEKDIQWMMNQFDLLELRTIRALPGHKYDIKIVRSINTVKMIYFSKIKRSQITPGGMNERIAQIAQVHSDVSAPQHTDAIHATGFLAQAKRAIGL